MSESLETRLLLLIMMLPVIVPAIAVHEFGHAWMADRCGDDTPRRQGRLTLDPLAHFELFGAIMIVVSFMSGFCFGWGRPVIVDPRHFRVPRRDDILVTAAGPAMNALQVGVWFLILVALRIAFGKERTGEFMEAWFGMPTGIHATMFWIAMRGILMNLGMIAFNLIPIPPLDGSRIVAQLSPTPIRMWFYQPESIGPFILLVVISTPGFLGAWMEPAGEWGMRLIARVLSIH